MDAASWGFIGTIAGATVGSLASVLTTLLAASNTRKLQSHSDSLARIERFRELQRTNLLELQEGLTMHMRFIGRAHMEDVASYRKDPHSASWPKLSDDLDQELTASNRRLSLLVERVADHDLRKKIKDIRPEFGRILFTRVSGESRSQFVALTDSFEKVMEELGAVLRSYY